MDAPPCRLVVGGAVGAGAVLAGAELGAGADGHFGFSFVPVLCPVIRADGGVGGTLQFLRLIKTNAYAGVENPIFGGLVVSQG